MQVTIRGQVLEYMSDFDPVNVHDNVTRNWKVSAGDYFKFPVKIGDTHCFIKRFSKKTTEISGYEFLAKIKGQQLKGLPAIFDIVHTVEADKNIIYLFTEFIKGDTVDNLQRAGFSFLPSRLGGDLFYGLQSIHENGFWFPDFDPKNFFRSEQGDFYVIDLDSTYPLSAMPANSMYGSKDYWAPAYEYYRNTWGFSGSDIKKIRGDVLNNLNLIYFLALYSFYLDGDGDDLTAHSISRLNDYALRKHKLFSSTLIYCCSKDGNNETIHQRTLPYEVFKNLVQTGLFPENIERRIASSPENPEITHFTINGKTDDSMEIYPGRPVDLEWSVKNATSIQLLPEGVQLEKSGKLSMIPIADIKYTLVAIHKYKSKSYRVSKAKEISIYDPELKRPVIEFFIDGGNKQPVLLENMSYKLKWSVSDAEKVFLDETEVEKNAFKDFNVVKNTTHTLRAVNSKNGSSKKNEARVDIVTEKRATIQLSVSSPKIRSGESVKLAWNVTDGKNVFIQANGNVIAKDLPTIGSLYFKPVPNTNGSFPQTFAFTASAYTNSGNWLCSGEPAQIVTVTKKTASYAWLIILAVILAVVLIYFLTRGDSKNKNYNFSNYDGRATDSINAADAQLRKDSADAASIFKVTDSAKRTGDDSFTNAFGDNNFVFYDDFENGNYYSWPSPDAAIGTKVIEYGKLELGSITGENVFSLKDFNIDTEKDFDFSVTSTWVKGITDGGYGFIFCSNALTNFYNLFCVSANGYRTAKYYMGSGDWQDYDEMGWAASENVMQQGTNILRVTKTGNYINFEINGTRVKEIYFNRNYGSYFGFIVTKAQTTSFDDFRLSGVKKN